MKKILCALFALALTISGFAIAEAPSAEAIDRFLDTWVGIGDRIAVEIWVDDETGDLACSATLEDGSICEYAKCCYDAEGDLLVCEDGTQANYKLNEETLEYDADVIASGLTASIDFVDGEDQLTFDDGSRQLPLQRLSDAEEAEYNEAQAFVGRWGIGRAGIIIENQEDGSYTVHISWAEDAARETEWHYVCVYDGETKLLHSCEPGTKYTITYDEDGAIDAIETVYEDGEASFAIDETGMLTWNDAKENAGEGMKFERSEISDATINTLIEDGSFIIQIPVDPDDEGWVADDMSQDDSIVKLYAGEVIEDTFVARYDAVGDGDVTVGVKHMKGIACDMALTWDLHVKNGAVQEVIGGSQAQSPDEMDQTPFIAGEWQVNDDIMAGMTIDKNDGDGWALQIATAGPEGAHVIRANLFYDCELGQFIYADGTLYASEITSDPEVVIGEALQTEVSGTLTPVMDENGDYKLEWYNALSPDETARFYRPEGWEDNIVYAMNDTVDLNDGTYPVSFDRANIVGELLNDVHIYTVDCYDIVDISKLAVGDFLYIENRIVPIETLDEGDGEKIINGGFEASDGYTLRPFDEDNCWKSVGYDDVNSYSLRDVATLTLSQDVVFTDGWDIERESETFTGIEAVTKAIAESEFEFFDNDNTVIRLEGGKVVEITRCYVP